MAPKTSSKKQPPTAKRERAPSSSSSSSSTDGSSSSSSSSSSPSPVSAGKHRKKTKDSTRKSDEKSNYQLKIDTKASTQLSTPKKPKLSKLVAVEKPSPTKFSKLDADKKSEPVVNARVDTKTATVHNVPSPSKNLNRQNALNGNNNKTVGDVSSMEQLLLQKFHELKVTKVLVEEQRREEEKRKRERLTRNTSEAVSATQVVRELAQKGVLERVQQATGQLNRTFKKSSRQATRQANNDTPSTPQSGGSATASPATSRASSVSSPAPSGSSSRSNSSSFNLLDSLMPPTPLFSAGTIDEFTPSLSDNTSLEQPPAPVAHGCTVFIKWHIPNAFDEQRLKLTLTQTCPGVEVKKVSFGATRGSAYVTLDSVASSERIVAEANGCMVNGVTIQVYWPRVAAGGAAGRGMPRGRGNPPPLSSLLKTMPKIARVNENKHFEPDRPAATAPPAFRLGSAMGGAAANAENTTVPKLHMPKPRNPDDDRPGSHSTFSSLNQKRNLATYDDDAV